MDWLWYRNVRWMVKNKDKKKGPEIVIFLLNPMKKGICFSLLSDFKKWWKCRILDHKYRIFFFGVNPDEVAVTGSF